MDNDDRRDRGEYEPGAVCDECGFPSPRARVCGECETAAKYELRIDKLEESLKQAEDANREFRELGRREGRADVAKYARAFQAIEGALGMGGAAMLGDTVGAVKQLVREKSRLEKELLCERLGRGQSRLVTDSAIAGLEARVADLESRKDGEPRP